MSSAPLKAGAMAGLLAGASVGLVEALVSLSVAPTGEYAALVVGSLAYGLFGGLLGVGMGGLLAIPAGAAPGLDPALRWALVFSATALLLGSAVVRGHQIDGGEALSAHLLSFAGISFLWLLLMLWLAPPFLRRTRARALLGLRGGLWTFGALLLLSASFGLSPGERAHRHPADALEADSDTLPDLILVVADGIGAGQLSPNELPSLSALGEEGLRFEQAISASSASLPSIASLLTAQSPGTHGALSPGDGLSEEVVSLAEVLADRGYVTGGLTNGRGLGRRSGLHQGFDRFIRGGPRSFTPWSESAAGLWLVDRAFRRWATLRGGPRPGDAYLPADQVLEAARTFLRRTRGRGRPAFLFLHLADPAAPWFAHGSRAIGVQPGELEAARLAREERIWLDQQVGAFLDWLRADARWEDTLFAFTSTGGEPLGRHGGWIRGEGLFEEEIHVPLILRLPQAELGGSEIPWQVRTIDLAPTLLTCIGLPLPEGWEGEDLLNPIARQLIESPQAPLAVEDRAALSLVEASGHRIWSLRDNGIHYLRTDPDNPRGLPLESLYDLGVDPNEEQDLVGRAGPTQARMAGLLRTMISEGLTPSAGL